MQVKSIFTLFAVALALNLFVSAPPQIASAASCQSHPRFTSWHYNRDERHWKPTLYIWGLPNNGHDSTGIGIYYHNSSNRWEQVPASSEWGVLMIPRDHQSQWTGYYIAGRWIADPAHWNWDDDWRWSVWICR